MANKLVIPAQAGAGSANYPAKTQGIPFHRPARLRTGTARVSVTAGQIWPRYAGLIAAILLSLLLSRG